MLRSGWLGTILDKARGRPPAQDALIELKALLADRQLRGVSEEQIEEIAERFQLDPHRRFRKEFDELYVERVRQCLVDRHLDDDELAELQHMKLLLSISDSHASEIHNRLSEDLYREDAQQAMADGRLSIGEREVLERLEKQLRLPEEIASRVHREVASARVQASLDSATSDQRLSPEEDQEFRAVASSLGIEPSFDAETKRALERMRLYWIIENGDVPEVPVDIRLQRSERCYFTTSIEWLEHRTVTKRIRYAGPTARIRIVKGVYFRAGDLALAPVREDVLQTIDSGTLYLTSKRILFTGARGNKTITLNKIIDFTPYRNGVDIQKATGKSPFFRFETDVDLFSLLLNRALDDIS